MTATATAQPPLHVQIGRAIVAASDTAAVERAIAAANEAGRMPGLDDGFNPRIIDPAKALAFLAALTKSPGDLQTRLAGRALDLDALHLRIGTSSPTTPASFTTAPFIQVTMEHPLAVSARAVVPVDCAAARQRATEARRLTEATQAEVRKLRFAAQTEAKQRRFLLSHVWLDNADAVLSCTPDDKAAAADRKAADKTMNAAIVPTGGSME
jgi:hypothetical protein